MKSDIRLTCSFATHPKTVKLKRRLGRNGAWSLVVLWAWAGLNRPSGDLAGQSDEDIAIAADWEGDAAEFVAALVDVRFLDGDQGGYRLHDWSDHQPYVAGSELRSLKARWNAIKGHHGPAEADRQVPAYAAIRRAAADIAATSNADSFAGSDAGRSATSSASSSASSTADGMLAAVLPERYSTTPYPSPKARAKAKAPPKPPKGGELLPEAGPVNQRRSSSEKITFATYASRCREQGVQLIPEGDPVFSYADRIGLPREFVALEWWWFQGKYAGSSTKQSAQHGWPQKFRNAVEGVWGRLWYVGEDGSYALTAAGKQAKLHMDASEAANDGTGGDQ